jgi:hypothetical protein
MSAGPGGCRPRPGQPETIPYLAKQQNQKEAVMADEIISELSHMGSLTAAITFMIAEAAELPDPEHMSVFGIIKGRVHDSVTLQFPPVEASTEAIALWALRFGGVVRSEVDDYEGVPTLWVRAEFTWQDFLRVDAFALIPLPVGAITRAGQGSEPHAATPF